MSLEVIITRCRSIESRLAELGATGRGLHEKVSSIESKLEEKLVKKIRFIASVRNKSTHEENYSLTDTTLERYVSVCNEVDAQLSELLHEMSPKTTSAIQSSPETDFIEQFKNASTFEKIGVVAAGALAVWALFNR